MQTTSALQTMLFKSRQTKNSKRIPTHARSWHHSSIQLPMVIPSSHGSKKDEWWLCDDYRMLNAATIPDRYPIPHIHDFSSRLSGALIFSRLSIPSNFHRWKRHAKDCYLHSVWTLWIQCSFIWPMKFFPGLSKVHRQSPLWSSFCLCIHWWHIDSKQLIPGTSIIHLRDIQTSWLLWSKNQCSKIHFWCALNQILRTPNWQNRYHSSGFQNTGHQKLPCFYIIKTAKKICQLHQLLQTLHPKVLIHTGWINWYPKVEGQGHKS